MAINLYLVRHGQTWFNKGHRMQGSCDSALTPLGIKQAEAVRDYFQTQGITFARTYCSTQERASDTLEIIAGPETEYVRLKELKEKDYGSFEAHNVLLWPLHRLGKFRVEDDREVVERMERGINLIMRDAQDGDNILVVGHGDSLSQYINEKTNHREFLGLPNCSFVQLTSNEGSTLEYVRTEWPAKAVKIDQITGE